MEKDILFVDDDKKVQKLYTSILERAGYLISVAGSGKEALERMRGEAYRLVLLDLKMPGMDGVEVFREIRKIDPNVPVYFITAFENAYFKALKAVRDEGFVFEILNKPVDRDEFLKVLDSVLGEGTGKDTAAVKLRLYIVGQTPLSEKTVNDLHELLEGAPGIKYTLEAIDIMENPEKALEDQILATPTLIQLQPLPSRRIVGDLTSAEKVFGALGLTSYLQCSK